MFGGKVIEKFITILDQVDFPSRFRNDLKGASKEVIIYCPYVEPGSPGYRALINDLKEAVTRNVDVKVVVREDIDRKKVEELINSGIKVYRRKTHVKAAIIDNKTIYIGSLNMLSSWLVEDVMIRISGITGKIIPKILSKKLFEEIKPPSEEERIT